MKARDIAALISLALLASYGSAAQEETFRLHPEHPRYFEFQGKPTVLITATEHYGAILNLDFDYITYLNELRARGFNLTRIFSGAYRELPGSFGIKENTLAPKADRFICPWARNSTPSKDVGKFDLTKWDWAYFARLKDFVAQAGKRGIIVELVFFCTFYSEELWQASPMNTRNNVNGIGNVRHQEAYAIAEPALQEAQVAMVRRIVTELNAAPNLYYEVCNEPYERAGLTRRWTHSIIEAIVGAESNLPRKHLIAEGINRDSPRLVDPHPGVSIFNFHAATPHCVQVNEHLGAFADDETGGKGIKDFPYRSEAWEFMLAGGAVFDHLDFSFTTSNPDGTHRLTNEPGGGGPDLRRQLQLLKEFFGTIDFIKMKSDTNVVRSVRSLDGAEKQKPIKVQALVEPGATYAIYFNGNGPCDATLDLPAGTYRAEWINTLSGSVDREDSFVHSGGLKTLRSPSFAEDVMLRINGAR